MTGPRFRFGLAFLLCASLSTCSGSRHEVPAQAPAGEALAGRVVGQVVGQVAGQQRAPDGAHEAATEAPADCVCAQQTDTCVSPDIFFCQDRWPADTQHVSCYEGRSGGGDEGGIDLTPLACMTRLESLSLVSGRLEFILTLKLDDLGPLAGLHALKQLRLGHTTVRDIAPLAGLRGLRELSLHASPVRDISPLAGLTELRELDLSGTAVADLTPLAGLKHLQRLDLSNTPVADVRVLMDLSKLQWLGLHNNGQLSDAQVAALRAHAPTLRITAGREY